MAFTWQALKLNHVSSTVLETRNSELGKKKKFVMAERKWIFSASNVPSTCFYYLLCYVAMPWKCHVAPPLWLFHLQDREWVLQFYVLIKWHKTWHILNFWRMFGMSCWTELEYNLRNVTMELVWLLWKDRKGTQATFLFLGQSKPPLPNDSPISLHLDTVLLGQ